MTTAPTIEPDVVETAPALHPAQLLVQAALSGSVVSDAELLTTPGVLPALREVFSKVEAESPAALQLWALARRVGDQFASPVRLATLLRTADIPPYSPLMAWDLHAVCAVSRHQASGARWS